MGEAEVSGGSLSLDECWEGRRHTPHKHTNTPLVESSWLLLGRLSALVVAVARRFLASLSSCRRNPLSLSANAGPRKLFAAGASADPLA